MSTPLDHQKSPDDYATEQLSGIEKRKDPGFGWASTSTTTQQPASNIKPKPTPLNLGLPTFRFTSDTDLASIITAPMHIVDHVYVFKSECLGFVKIGTSFTNTDEIKPQPAYCGLKAFQKVEMITGYRCRFPRRAERLAQMELSGFREIPACTDCKELSAKDLHEHHSWFEVAADVAVKSVEMWAKFVDQAYADSGKMLPEWEKAVKALPQPSERKRKEDAWHVHQEREVRLMQEKLKAWMEEWGASIG
jgi:hypothetical protein